MPYFSMSSKYRAPSGMDATMKRWANGLPLSAIQGEIEGSGLGSGFLSLPSALYFTKVNQDTAGFFPVLSIATPATTITIPKEAGGLYIFSLYAVPQLNHAVGAGSMKTQVDRSLSGVGFVNNSGPMVLDVLDRTLVGFDYFNPGDIISPQVAPGASPTPRLDRYVFRLARLSV